MKATKRRILKIVDEIENFECSPLDDLDGVFSSLQSLSGIAERLRASAALLPHPPLQSRLEAMDGVQDPLHLRDQLVAASELIRDAFEDFGDDLAKWPAARDLHAEVGNAEAEELMAEIAELKKKLKDPSPKRRASYLRCILVMAVSQYRYRPGAARQNTAVRIAKASGSGLLKITDETVNSILQEAVDHLGIDQTELDELLGEVGTS
jgi:hypothetical protein